MNLLKNLLLPRAAVSASLFLLLAQAPAFAMNGCTDSPENPTAILGLLGAAAGSARYLYQKHRARRG